MDLNFEELKIETPILEIDFNKLFEESYICPSEEVVQQPIAISIRDSVYKGQRYPIPFGSYGDFSCIVGASKSRKTFFTSMIIAGYIGGQSNIINPSIKGHNTKDKFVISIDTEQSRFHAQRVQRRVLEMVGCNYEFLKTFGLRPYSPKERFQFIDWLINESEYKGKIGLLVIDGFVDLVTDFNSLEQATGLTDKLLQWTSNGGMHITGILHKNFGSSKPVGHVGSSVLKKAETVVFIESDKENNQTVAKCEYSRNLEFEDIVFTVNNDWLPVEIQDEISSIKPNWV